MKLRRAIPALATAALLAVTGLAQAGATPSTGSSGSSDRPAETCPASVDPASFTSPDELERLNAKIAGFGLRSTASPEHERLTDWLESRLKALPDVSTRSDAFTIKRWQPSPRSKTGPGRDLAAAGRLALPRPGGEPEQVPTAGAVPYSQPTGEAGRTAPLVYLPAGTEITPENSRGRIVIRDVQFPAVPYAAFGAFSHFMTPDFPMLGNYERPFTGEYAKDPIAAGRAGAAGLIMAWNVPAAQIQGYFDPHTGTHFTVPAVWAGVDEAVRLKQLAEQGAEAKITVLADVDDAPTRNLIATIPGQSQERIVINTNTDGNTWVQENSSATMLVLAKYLSRLPMECRPRTYEFVFGSAHLHMSKEGTDRYATQLDKEYDAGSVAFAFAVEHMGTREILPVNRANGPGQQLAFTGAGEPYSWFAGSESPAISSALVAAVKAHPLDRTSVLRGFDLPKPGRVPAQCSFGGLGTTFHSRLIPAIGGISGPWSLWAPSFGPEAIDFNRMYQQALVVGDTLLALDGLSREELAGAYPAERAARAAGTPTCTHKLPPEDAPGPQG
ncbi:hypothetical protein ACWFRB_08540 [Rhodococcus sp. NPDC055112]